jgi:hypothetical protein
MLRPRHGVPRNAGGPQGIRWKRLWRHAAAATVSVVAAAPVVEHASPAAAAPAAYENGVHRVVTTAYCLDGRMANGEPTHDGAAAMRGVPLGTSVTILDGPEAGRVLVVKDRLRKRGILDIWMDDCGAARQHGAGFVTIQVGA